MLKVQDRRISLLRTRAVVLLLLMTFLVGFEASPSFGAKGGERPQDIRVIGEGFSYSLGKSGGRHEYSFRRLRYIQAQGTRVCYAEERPEIDKSLSPEGARQSILSNLQDAIDIADDKGGRCLSLIWVHKDEAARFVSAVNRLIWENSPDVRAQRFDQKVAAWRAAGSKAELPEEARTGKVLAENAYQEKDLPKAISEYEAALEIFPTWPAGQFNVALICGETGDYECAIEHMQDYLELVPDATDAQAAKDKIIIWKDKVAHSE